MSSSIWTPLPDKENPAFAFKPSSKVLGGGPVKISNRGAIPKKQVFGDLKNTIQNFKAESDESGINKGAKSRGQILCSNAKPREEEWPEPESLPAEVAVDDDYEDCLLPGLKFSEAELEDLSDIFGKISRTLPTRLEPDSPITLPEGRLHLDIKLEFPEDCMYEMPPVWVDDD